LIDGLIEPALRHQDEVLADEQLLQAVLGRRRVSGCKSLAANLQNTAICSKLAQVMILKPLLSWDKNEVAQI
jgi:hypothetical protein